MIQIRISREKGFTLVELSLAIVMVAILAMGILTISLQVMKIYSKGTTLKSMNQASRDISDQLTRDIRSTPVNAIDYDRPSNSHPGRLCLGSVAYVWNTMNTLSGLGSKIVYSGVSGIPDNTPVHFARLVSQGSDFCKTPYTYNVTSAYTPTELLGNTANNLAIYDLSVSQLVTGGSLYQINYTFGTNDSTVVAADQSQCRPPTDNQANFDFCTVSSFQLLIKSSDTGGN